MLIHGEPFAFKSRYLKLLSWSTCCFRGNFVFVLLYVEYIAYFSFLNWLCHFFISRYVFGITHIPRLEDWPVMPVERIGFMLMVPFLFLSIYLLYQFIWSRGYWLVLSLGGFCCMCFFFWYLLSFLGVFDLGFCWNFF